MATCKDCIHYEVCGSLGMEVYRWGRKPTLQIFLDKFKAEHCTRFKPSFQFVELPCKVGDTLYTVVRGYKIREWIVTDICFSDYLPISVMVITARDKRNSEHIRFADHYLGKTVFLTREKAEQALKERGVGETEACRSFEKERET